MKNVFAGLLAFLLLLSAVAWWWYPRHPDDGRIHLTINLVENPSTREQVARFNELNPDLRVTMDADDADNIKVIVQSLAGVGPDMVVVNDAATLDGLVRAGVAMDLTDKFEALGIDPQRDLWRGSLPSYQYTDGRYYGFPHNVAVNCLWFHRKLIEEAGIDMPLHGMTWMEFVEIGRKLTKRNADGRIIQYGFGIDWLRWPLFVAQWGGEIYSEDGTRCTLDSPEAIAGIQFMYDLMYQYEIAPTPRAEAAMASQAGLGKDTAIVTQFGGRRIATAMGGRWWMILLRRFDDLNLGVAEGPHAKHRIFLGYGKSVIINQLNPHTDACLRFLKFLTTDDFHEIIHRHADGFGSNRNWAYNRGTLDDPNYPQETWNEVWRDTMELSEPQQESPFANSQIMQRILIEQLDLMKNNLKSPGDAMREATRQINAHIAENVGMRPDLRALWRERTGRPWEATP